MKHIVLAFITAGILLFLLSFGSIAAQSTPQVTPTSTLFCRGLKMDSNGRPSTECAAPYGHLPIVVKNWPPTPTPTGTSTPTPTPTPTPTGTSTPVFADLVPIEMGITLETGHACNYSSTQLGVRVSIANIGHAGACPFVVDVNGSRQTVACGLPADHQLSLWFGGAYIWPGNNTVIVDVLNQVAESNEENNSLNQWLPIPTLPATCTPTATQTPCDGLCPTRTPTPVPSATLPCGGLVVPPECPTDAPTPTWTPTPTETRVPCLDSYGPNAGHFRGTCTGSSIYRARPAITAVSTPSQQRR